MKKIAEIHSWLQGAAVQFGDPSLAVGQIFARFVGGEPADYDEAMVRWDNGFLRLFLGGGEWFEDGFRPEWFSVGARMEGPEIDEETGGLKTFGISEVCPGFWTLFPSLNIPGELHCFIHIYNVPVRAPWKSLIIPATRIPSGLIMSR